jgi:hypothetical protein
MKRNPLKKGGMIIVSNELMHYGILGMKWGRRKATRQTSDDYRSVKKIRKKHYSEMSNAELRKANERLQLEANYKNLTKKKTGIGKRVVDRMINRAVDKSIDYSVKVGEKIVDKIIKGA